MHTRPNVYMDEVLLGGKTGPKFHTNQHYHQSATSINNNNPNNMQSLNMRNRQRKWRVLLSIGLLLPALAAIIGIVAWTISIEVASANEATGGSQKSQNHQNHHHHHNLHHQHQHQHPHSHSHHPHQSQSQSQPINQNEQPSRRHLQQQQQQPPPQPSIALPQQAAETKSESQACATLVLTNLKQQLDSNSDNVENRASKTAAANVALNDDTSSYETDEQPEQRQPEATTANQSKPDSSPNQQQQQQQQQQQDDDSSYEAIASAISTTLRAGGAATNSPAEPSSASALGSKLLAEPDAPSPKRTTGESVADVIDHLVLRRRQATAAAANTNKGRPSMRASRIVVVAPMDDSMKARSLTRQVETETSSSSSSTSGSDERVKQEQDAEPISEPSAAQGGPADEDEEREVDENKLADTEQRPASSPEDADEEPAIDRGDWVPAWPLRRELHDGDDLSIHVSSQPKEARARSRRQEINPSLAFERIASLTKQQQKQQQAPNGNESNRQQQQKLYSTEQIIRDHVSKSKSKGDSQPVGEPTGKQPEQHKTQVVVPPQAPLPQQKQPQPQEQLNDAPRQQQQQQQYQQLARLAAESRQQLSFLRPQPGQQHLNDLVSGASSISQQQHQQVPRFFTQPNQYQGQQQHHFNPSPNHQQLHQRPHLQQQQQQQYSQFLPQPQLIQPQLLQPQLQQQQQHSQNQPAIHTTEHHFLLSPSQFQNFMNSPLFQQPATRRQQVANSRNGAEPAATPVGATANKPPQAGALEPSSPSLSAAAAAAASGAMRAMRSLATSQVQQQQVGLVADQEPQGSEVRSMRYLTNGPAGSMPLAGAEGLVISEQQQAEAAAALAGASSEPRPQLMAAQQHPGETGAVQDQEVQESYGQMPAYQMAEGYGGGGGGHQYQQPYGGDQDKKSKGITFHFGGGPIGGGTQLITSPMGIFKHLMIPLLPNPRVNLNGKVVFGVVLEKSTAFGSPPKKRKYKFWGR